MDTTYRLSQTGKEVQQLLDQVTPNKDAIEQMEQGKQDTLTFDQVPTTDSNNPVTSGGIKQAIDAIGQGSTQGLAAEVERARQAEQDLQDDIDGEATERQQGQVALQQQIAVEQQRAEGVEGDLQADIDDINTKIPTTASSQNKMATEQFVNSSIATATADFKGTFNSLADLQAVTSANANDYAYVVSIDTAGNTVYSRYKYVVPQGQTTGSWQFEYTLNNSSFTAAQWAAIQSGITTLLVAKLLALPAYGDLMTLFGTKQDVLRFDTTPTANSNNPVYSGGIKHALDDKQDALTFDNEPTRFSSNPVKSGALYDLFAALNALIPAQATSSNQLADKQFVNSSIATSTAEFKGTFNSLSELEAVTGADVNDYGYVVTTDAAGNTVYKRYKYVDETGWTFEYDLNNSSFTAAEWASIQSGITAVLVQKLDALPTMQELTQLLAGKQNALTFDTTPTQGSTNPVTSNGVYQAIMAATGIEFVDVQTLPTAGAATLGKIYLIPNATDPTASDWYVTIYDENHDPVYYWKQVSTTSVDLSNYYTKQEADARLDEKNVTVRANTAPTAETLTYVSTATGATKNHIVGDKRIVPNAESESGYDIYFLADITNGAATWIQGGGGSGSLRQKLWINLNSNQQDDTSLNGLSVRVEADGDTILDTTWQGETLYCQMAPMLNVTVTVGSKAGYALASNTQTFESQVAGERTVNFNYQTCVVTFLPTSNQGSGDTAIESATGTINGTSVNYGDSVKVVPGTQVTVVAGGLANYTAPAQYTGTAEGASLTPTMLYQTTLVTVTWESNLGTDPVIAAVKATVAGRQVSSGETIKVATGTQVSVVFPDVEGYRKPTIADFAAEGTSVVKPVVQYSTDVYTVSIDSNQTDKTDISGLKVTVNDGTEDKQLADGDIVKIPTGTTPVPTAPDVTGYRKTIDVQTGNKTITVQYDTTLVSVQATSNQGNDPVLNNLVFQINGTDVSAGSSVKVPTGDALTISAPDITNYAKQVTAAATAAGSAYVATVAYSTTLVAVNMVSSTAGVEGAAPQDAEATVSYQGGTGQTIKNGQFAKVPTGTAFTITYGTAEGYSAPVSYSGTAEGASMTATKAVYLSGAVSVSINMSDGDAQALALAGATIAIDGGTPVAYQGTPISVTPGASVEVVFTPVDRYATPTTQQFTMPSSGYTVEATYQTTHVGVQMVGSVEGVEGAAPTGAGATVKYQGGTDQAITNTTTAKVPTGTAFTIEYDAVSNYSTPATYSGTATGASMTATKATYIYGALKVEVTMSDSDDTALADVSAQIAINGGSATAMTGTVDATTHKNTFTANLDEGDTYVISFGSVEGYATPASISGTKQSGVETKTAEYQTDIYTLTVTGQSRQETVEYTQGGQAVSKTIGSGNSVKVPTGTTPTVASAYVKGYSREVTIGTVTAHAATITVAYSTTATTIAILSNQTSDQTIAALQATVAWTYDGHSESETAGNGQSVSVPTGVTPTVTFPQAPTGYSREVSQDGLTATYSTTIVSVNMVGVNGGVEGAAPTGAGATVKYQGGTDQHIDNSTTAKVPTGTAFTIEYDAVANYSTPATYSATAAGTSMTATKASYVYGVLKVEVTMNDNDNTDLALITATIAVNGGSATAMQGVLDTTNHKMTFDANLETGDTYVIAFGQVEGYATPASISDTKGSGVETKTAEYETDIYTLSVTGQSRQETIEYTQGGQTVSKTISSGNSVKVPAGTTPTVASAYVKGYARSVTIGTVTAHAATITVAYETTVFTTNMTSNQTGDVTITALQATVAWTYDGHSESETLDSGDTVNVPTGVTPTITFPDATGYTKTVTNSGNAYTAAYTTEIITVALASDTGEADLSSVTITVTDTTASATIAPFATRQYKVPSGHGYSVSVSDDVEGYAAPAAATGTAAATTDAATTVTMTYEEQAGFVDLGLPSGKKWAVGNLVKDSQGNYSIGAETDWGTYVSWGNIDGHNEGDGYDFSDANYQNTPGYSVSADIASNDATHDIARARLGGAWHQPTKNDFQELYDNTDTEWVANYNNTGVAGRKFMKKTDHSVYIFLPASGYYGTSLFSRGSSGYYWSASWSSQTDAYSLHFSSSTVNPQDNSRRRLGFPVRPVQ